MSPLEITIYCDKSNSRNVIRKIGFKDEVWMDEMKSGTSIDFIEKRYVIELESKLEVAKKALEFIEKLHEDDIVLTSTEYNHKSATTYRKTIEALKEME